MVEHRVENSWVIGSNPILNIILQQIMINFKNKPLTPHLTIYKTESSSLYSIWHRITGILLLIFLLINSLGFKLFSWEIGILWNYKLYNLITNCNITIIYIIFSICLLFHILNGIRLLNLKYKYANY